MIALYHLLAEADEGGLQAVVMYNQPPTAKERQDIQGHLFDFLGQEQIYEVTPENTRKVAILLEGDDFFLTPQSFRAVFDQNREK